MKTLFTLFIICISFNSTAESKWSGYLTYSQFDLWIPGKIGLVASYKEHDKRTYELAWQKASYGFDLFVDDIGSVSEQRIHFTTRSFKYGTSFNYQYGLLYTSYLVNLGKGFVGFDLVEIKTLGGLWGVGNRWELERNIDIGIDWFKVFVPVVTLEKENDALDSAESKSDKNDLKDLLKAFTSIPTITVLHFEVGYRF